MGKIQERNNKEHYLFERGDVVIAHPSRKDLITTGEGIILVQKPLTENQWHQYRPDILEKLQNLLVFFAPRETDLYVAARRLARSILEEPGYQPTGIILTNQDLQLVFKNRGWLDPPTLQEIQMLRFSDVEF